MVVGLYHLLELGAQEIANGGHQRLEKAKPESTNQGHAPGKLLGGQSFTNGDREGIHGKTNGDQ